MGNLGALHSVENMITITIIMIIIIIIILIIINYYLYSAKYMCI